MILLRQALLTLLLLTALPAWAKTLAGRVVAIANGGALTLPAASNQQVKVRLHGIDAPESREAWGTRARQALSGMAFQREVRVEVRDTDRYGQTIGRVYAAPVNVNAEMVRRGMAWVYTRSNRDPALALLEVEARAACRAFGLIPVRSGRGLAEAATALIVGDGEV